MKIILASASPRRKDILNLLGLPFSVLPADIDESVHTGEDPSVYVERLAQEKASAGVELNKEQFLDALVIGSDLTLDLDGRSLGKAKDVNEAREFLRSFSGRSHFGRCGWAVMQGNKLLGSGVATTTVEFHKLSDTQIEDYLDSKEWIGLGGAYGVQNKGAAFVKSFIGSYYNILGLPIYEIAETLINFGIEINPEKLLSLKEQDVTEVARLNSGG